MCFSCFTFSDSWGSSWFSFISTSMSLSFLPHFFVFPSTHLFLVLPVVNMLISSSGGGREERRLNCWMANNCAALIAILNSVFRNNQIRESVRVCMQCYTSACGRMCFYQAEIMQESAEKRGSAVAISALLLL